MQQSAVVALLLFAPLAVLKVQALTVPQALVEERPESKQPKAKMTVLFNIITSQQEVYRSRLKSDLNTWASGLSQNELQITGVLPPVENNTIAHWVPANSCGDNHELGFACKEARSIVAAYERGTDWLVIVGEDNYVLTDRVKQTLKSYNASEPVYLGIPGCGGGTLCEDKQGGMCGGGGEFLSRGALEQLLDKGRDAFIREHMEAAKTVTQGWGDITTGCLARRHGVKLTLLPGLHGWRMNSSDIKKSLEPSAHPKALLFHYVSDASEMSHLYNMVQAAESVAPPYASLSFKEGKGGTPPDMSSYLVDVDDYIRMANVKYLMNAESFHERREHIVTRQYDSLAQTTSTRTSFTRTADTAGLDATASVKDPPTSHLEIAPTRLQLLKSQLEKVAKKGGQEATMPEES